MYVMPSIVSAGPSVMIAVPEKSVEVTPLMTMTELEALAGMEYVVPETVSMPPGVSVWPGARTYAVVPLTAVAVMERPPASVKTEPEPEPRVDVCPLTTIVEPWPLAGML
jgi:hypothetical protein